MSAPAPYRVRARNHAEASSNRIHDPEFARSLGFEGGLVPGVDVYAYLTRPVVEAWGIDWLARGAMEARFARPVYDGDALTIEVEGDGTELRLQALNQAGEVAATGLAELRPAEPPPEAGDYPPAALPEQPPPAEVAAFRARPILGSLERRITEADAEQHRREVDEQLDVYAREGIVHPAHLLRFADSILLENFSLPPWMHVSSRPRHFRTARIGETLSVRARLIDLFERKGHEFVQLDVLVAGVDGPVARVMPYTAIYRPAFTR